MPVDRRNRRTSAVNDPRTPMGITRIRNCAAPSNGPIASMPIGFAAPGTGDSCIGAGSSRIEKKTTVSATPRHPREPSPTRRRADARPGTAGART